MANASLENISLRDKLWFHPILRLSYDTTPVQLRSVLSGLAELLEGHPSVENNSIRVSFLPFGTMALEIEIFAYLLARDWSNFLAAGTRIAPLPSALVQSQTPNGAATVGVGNELNK
jgi:MscS family membrane protein